VNVRVTSDVDLWFRP